MMKYRYFIRIILHEDTGTGSHVQFKSGNTLEVVLDRQLLLETTDSKMISASSSSASAFITPLRQPTYTVTRTQ